MKCSLKGSTGFNVAVWGCSRVAALSRINSRYLRNLIRSYDDLVFSFWGFQSRAQEECGVRFQEAFRISVIMDTRVLACTCCVQDSEFTAQGRG